MRNVAMDCRRGDTILCTAAPEPIYVGSIMPYVKYTWAKITCIDQNTLQIEMWNATIFLPGTFHYRNVYIESLQLPCVQLQN